MKARNFGRKGLAILLSLTIAMSMMPTAVFASSVNVADAANTIVSGDGTINGGTVITNDDGSMTIVPTSGDSEGGTDGEEPADSLNANDENGDDGAAATDGTAAGSGEVEAEANANAPADTDRATGSNTGSDQLAGTDSAASGTDEPASAATGSSSAPTVGDMALNAVLDSALGDNTINDDISLYADTEYEYKYEVLDGGTTTVSEWGASSDLNGTNDTKEVDLTFTNVKCFIDITTPNTIGNMTYIIEDDGDIDYSEYLKITKTGMIYHDVSNGTYKWRFWVEYLEPCAVTVTFFGIDTSETGTAGLKHTQAVKLNIQSDTQTEYKYEVKDAGSTTTVSEWTAYAGLNPTKEAKLKYTNSYGFIYITTPNTINEMRAVIGDGKTDYSSCLTIGQGKAVLSGDGTTTWLFDVTYKKQCVVTVKFYGDDTDFTGTEHTQAVKLYIQRDPEWTPLIAKGDGSGILAKSSDFGGTVTYIKDGKDSLYYGYLAGQVSDTTSFTPPTTLTHLFSSSNTDVATVANSTDANSHTYGATTNWGDITIHAPGTTKLTISTANQNEWLARSKSVTLVVKPKNTSDWTYFTKDSVSFNWAEIPMNNKLTVSDLANKGVELVAAKHDSNGPTVAYSSSNTDLVTVDSSGNLSVKEGECGTATITATVTPDSTGIGFGYTAKSVSYTLTITNPSTLDFTNSTYIPERLTQLLSANGGTAAWDATANKLTLNGITFTHEVIEGQDYDAVADGFFPAIVLPAGANVVLQGENKIVGDDTSGISGFLSSAAILAYDLSKEDADDSEYQNLSITGSGSLDISGFSVGFYVVYANIVIDTGSITLNQTSTGGIFNTGLVVEGELKIDGGDVKIVKKSDAGEAETIAAIFAENIAVTGGTLDVDWQVSSDEGHDNSEGVIACATEFNISGGKVDIDVAAYDDANAVHFDTKGQLNVSGGEMNIKILGASKDVDHVYGIYASTLRSENDCIINVTGGVLTVDSNTDYTDDVACYGIGYITNYIELKGGYTLFNACDSVFKGVTTVNTETSTAKYSATYNGTNNGEGSDFVGSDYTEATPLTSIRSLKASSLNETWSESLNLSDINLFYSQATYEKVLDLGAYDGEVTLSSSDKDLFTVTNVWSASTKKNKAVITLNSNCKTGKNAKLIINAPHTSAYKGETLEIKVNVLPMVRYGFGDYPDRANAFLTQNGGSAGWDASNKTLNIKGINAKGGIILPNDATLEINGENVMYPSDTAGTQFCVIGVGDLYVDGSGLLAINKGSMIAGGLSIDGGEVEVSMLAAITNTIAQDKAVLAGLFEDDGLSSVIFADDSSGGMRISGGTTTVRDRVYVNSSFEIWEGTFTLNGKFSKATVNGTEYKSAAPQLEGKAVYAEYGPSKADTSRYTNETGDAIYDCSYFKATDGKISLSNILGDNPTATVSYCDAYISTVTNIPTDWKDFMGDDTTISCDVLQGNEIVDTDVDVETYTTTVKKYDSSTGDITNEEVVVLKLKLNDDCILGKTKVRISLKDNSKYADAQADWEFTVTGEADFTKSEERALALINLQQEEKETGGSAEIDQDIVTMPNGSTRPGMRYLKLENVDFDNTIVTITNLSTCGNNTIKELKGNSIYINRVGGEADSSLTIDGNVTSGSDINIWMGSVKVNGYIDASSMLQVNNATLVVACEDKLFSNSTPVLANLLSENFWAFFGTKVDGSDAVMVSGQANTLMNYYDADTHHYFKLSFGEEMEDLAFAKTSQTVSYCVNADGIIDMQQLNGVPEDYPTDNISYSTSDSTIATLTTDGRLQLNNSGKTGTVTVTAKLPAVDGKYKQKEVSYTLTVIGGTADFVNAPDRAVQLISGGDSTKAAWDAASKTLTLNGVTYSAGSDSLDDEDFIVYYTMQLPSGIKLVVNGTNTFEGFNSDSVIHFAADAEIQAGTSDSESKLVLKSKEGTDSKGDEYIQADYGVKSASGANLKVSGDVTLDVYDVKYAIGTDDSKKSTLTLEKDAKLELKAGTKAIAATVTLSLADGIKLFGADTPSTAKDYAKIELAKKSDYECIRAYYVDDSSNKLVFEIDTADSEGNIVIEKQYYELVNDGKYQNVATNQNSERADDPVKYEITEGSDIADIDENTGELTVNKGRSGTVVVKATQPASASYESGKYDTVTATYTLKVGGTAYLVTNNSVYMQRSLDLLNNYREGNEATFADGVLTLKNVVYSVEEGTALQGGIKNQSPGSFNKIKIVGKNEITAGGDDGSYAILGRWLKSLVGEGEDASLKLKGNRGLYVYGFGMTIENLNLTVETENECIESLYQMYGNSNSNPLEIKNSSVNLVSEAACFNTNIRCVKVDEDEIDLKNSKDGDTWNQGFTYNSKNMPKYLKATIKDSIDINAAFGIENLTPEYDPAGNSAEIALQSGTSYDGTTENITNVEYIPVASYNEGSFDEDAVVEAAALEVGTSYYVLVTTTTTNKYRPITRGKLNGEFKISLKNMTAEEINGLVSFDTRNLSKATVLNGLRKAIPLTLKKDSKFYDDFENFFEETNGAYKYELGLQPVGYSNADIGPNSGSGEYTVWIKLTAVNDGKYNTTDWLQLTGSVNIYDYVADALELWGVKDESGNYTEKTWEYEYDGQPHQASLTISDMNDPYNEANDSKFAPTVKYALILGETESGKTTEAPVNVGTYAVYVAADATSSFAAIPETKVGTLTINAKTGVKGENLYSYTESVSVSWRENGYDGSYLAELKGDDENPYIIKKDSNYNGTLIVKFVKQGSDNVGEQTVYLDKATDVGTYDVYIGGENDSNYGAVTMSKMSGTFTVTKAEYSGLSFDNLSIVTDNKVYYNNPKTSSFTHAVKGSLDGASVTYEVTEGEDIASVDSDGNVTLNNVGKFGKVTVTATQAATDCYEEATAAYTFNVLGVAYFNTNSKDESRDAQNERSLQLLQYQGGLLAERDETKANWDSTTNTLTIKDLTYSVDTGVAIKLASGKLLVEGTNNNISSADYYAIYIGSSNAVISGKTSTIADDVLNIQSKNGYGIQVRDSLTISNLTLKMDVDNDAFSTVSQTEYGTVSLDNAALTVQVNKKIRDDGITAFNYNESELYAVAATNKSGDGATTFESGSQLDSSEDADKGVKYLKTTVKSAPSADGAFSIEGATDGNITQVYDPNGNTVNVTMAGDYDYTEYTVKYVENDANGDPIKGGDGNYVTNDTAKGVGTYSIWVSAAYTDNYKAVEGIIGTLTVTKAELKVADLSYSVEKNSITYDGNAHSASDFELTVKPNADTEAAKYVNKSGGSFTLGFKSDAENASVVSSITAAGEYTVWVKRVDSLTSNDGDCYSGLEGWTHLQNVSVTIAKAEPTLKIKDISGGSVSGDSGKRYVRYCETITGIKLKTEASNNNADITYEVKLVEDARHGKAKKGTDILTVDESGNVKINDNGYFGTVTITAKQAADDNHAAAASEPYTFRVSGQADFRAKYNATDRALKLINTNSDGSDGNATWADGILTLENVNFESNGETAIIAADDATLKVKGTNSASTDGAVTLQGFSKIIGENDSDGKLAKLTLSHKSDAVWWIKYSMASIENVDLTLSGKYAVIAKAANIQVNIDGAKLSLEPSDSVLKVFDKNTSFKGFFLTDDVKGTYTTDGDAWTVLENTSQPTWTEVKEFKTELKYALTVNASPKEGGTVSVSGNKAYAASDETVEFTVTPNEGYKLGTVSIMNGNVPVASIKSNGTYTFTMPDADVTITATFAKEDYHVTVNSSVNGKVSTDKANANMGDTVTLTVTPGDKYMLDSLTVTKATDNRNVEITKKSEGEYEFTMPADSVNVSATFEKNNFSINVANIINGSVIPDKYSANKGDIVKLTVKADSGYEYEALTVKNGENDVETTAGENGSYTFTMPNGNVTVSATFKAIEYDVTIGGTEHGTVTAENTTGLNIGDTVTLTVTSETGYKLDTLTVMNGETPVNTTEGANGTYKFTMPAANVSVSATFVKEDYNVTIITPKNGSVSSESSSAKMDETVTLTVEPSEGYRLVGLMVVAGTTSVDTTAGENGSYTFTMPANSVTVTAMFEKETYTVTVQNDGNGTGKITNTGSLYMGDTVNLSATAATGYKFKAWEVVGGSGLVSFENANSANTTFAMPPANVTVKATFEKETYTVTVQNDGNGTGKITNTGSLYMGDTVNLSATAATGYKFKAWEVVGGSGSVSFENANSANTTFAMPPANVTVKATFEKEAYNVSVNASANGKVVADNKVANMGDTVTLTVTPDEGYKLNTLTVTGSDGAVETDRTDDNITFTMPAGTVTVKATFEAIGYEVKINEAENGSVSTAKTSGLHINDKVTLNISAGEGYELDTLTYKKDGAENSVSITEVDGTYSFTMPAGNVTVTATFKAINYTVSIADGIANGTVGADNTTATIGSTVKLTATPDDGYMFEAWSVTKTGGESVEVTGNSFTMPASSVTVSATFKAIDYTVSIAENIENGSVTANPTKANVGNTVGLTATPKDGYTFEAWNVTKANGESVEVTDNSFTMPASSVTVSAIFKAIDYKVTIKDTENGTVTATPNENVHINDEVTLTISADEGYKLESLKVGDSDVTAQVTEEGTYTFTMGAADVTVSATFKAIDYKVTINGTENGTVTATPNENVHINDEVTLTISADEGYKLESLKVGDSDVTAQVTEEGTYTFTMGAADVTVSATFKAIDYTVSVENDGHGTANASSESASIGDEITLTATPAKGYEFGAWVVEEGDVTVSGNAFTMPAKNVKVKATFKAIDYSVSVADSIENGSISITTADTSKLHVGDIVTLTVTADSGYCFMGLTFEVGGETAEIRYNGTDGTYTFEMPAVDVTVGAEFETNTYSITTATDIQNGTIEVTNEAHYKDEVTVTVRPSDGYRLDTLTYVSEGEENPETITGNTFEMPAANVTVSATFKAIDYKVTIKDTENGTVTATPNENVHINDEVTLTISADEGYKLESLKVGDSDVTAQVTEGGTYTFTMGAADVTVSATFKAIDYKVTINGTENGTVTATPNENVHINDEVTLTISADGGYKLESLKVGDSDVTAQVTEGGTYTFTMGAADITVSATFASEAGGGDEPTPPTPTAKYAVTVEDGTGGGDYEAGETVTITADEPESGFVFDKWEVTAGTVTLAAAASATTTFTMPASAVSVKATYKKENVETVEITGTIVSWDNDNNAVVKLYDVTKDDADIRADMRADMSAALSGYDVTLGTDISLESRNYKQSFTLSGSLADGSYKLAIYKAKKGGTDPYVVSVVTVKVEKGIATIEGVDNGNVKMWLYGDVNYDGSVNAKDAGQASRYGVGLSSLVQEDHESVDESHRYVAADVNADGDVNAKDAGQMSRRGVGLSSLLDNFAK